MIHWSAKYIGIPYLDHGRDAASGCDCWGLVRLIYAEQIGIVLPSYTEAYSSAEESAEVRGLIEDGQDLPAWCEVKKPQAFDLLLFRRGRHLSHVGVAVDGRRMLHIQGDDQAKIDAYRGTRLASRLMGVYRHVKSPVKGAL